jgi:hypothetical protein
MISSGAQQSLTNQCHEQAGKLDWEQAEKRPRWVPCDRYIQKQSKWCGESQVELCAVFAV